ncbi:MAG: RidA family protein [Kiloniellales bacterium]
MHKRHRPDGVPVPASRYSQAIETDPGLRWLYISGQVGLAADGALAASEEGQHEQAWRNVLRLLAASGMGPGDLVRVNGYVTSAAQVPLFRKVRDRMLEGAEPASSLVVVAGLVDSRWVVEIEAVAAAR